MPASEDIQPGSAPDIEAMLESVRSAAESEAQGDSPDAAGGSAAATDAAASPKGGASRTSSVDPSSASSGGRATGDVAGPTDDIELLLRQAQEAVASVADPTRTLPDGITSFELRELSGSAPSTERASLELLRDVELDLKIELGRTHMYLEDVLKLRKGSVVTLDKLAGDPVDIYVNGRHVARGEVLVLNDNFCVRVAELIAGEEQGGA
jgi:flagellar motor switch protein FliN/FliY